MPSPIVSNRSFFTVYFLLHFYSTITITRCISISSNRVPATAIVEEPITEGIVQLEHGSSSPQLTKEGPSGSGVDGVHLLDGPASSDLVESDRIAAGSDNHIPAPERLTEEAASTCPEDSVPKAGGGCECPPDADGCPDFPPPPCMFRLTLVEAVGTPGHCCPRYECVGCEREEDRLLGRCQCAKGALIDPQGRTCRCLDPHKSLVKGECVCDELKCRLPTMCSRKSVAVQVQEGCCKKTVCTPCPPDSESTALNSDIVEDHCVCLPCDTNCGYNETVLIKKKGTGFPGSCCDLYECRQSGGGGGGAGVGVTGADSPLDEESGGEDAKAAAVDASALYCLVGDVRHPDGAIWTTHDHQICHCISGLSRCSSSEKVDELENPCFVDLKWYANGENWTKEDGCTQCICRNGEQQCISHFCEVKESHIHSGRENDTSAAAAAAAAAAASANEGVSTPCVSSEGRTYRHMDAWAEKGGCSTCICYSGMKQCQDVSGCLASASASASASSSVAPSSPSIECQPLANCNKSCTNGYKIDRMGCEICECNAGAGAGAIDDDNIDADSGNFDGHHLLAKYNISMADLIRILDEYRNRHSNPATTATTASSTTTTTTTTLSSSSGDVEDSVGLSSRIWKEVIRTKGGVPRREEEEEKAQRRPLNDTKAYVIPPIDPHSAADITLSSSGAEEAEEGGNGSGSRGRAHVIVACMIAAAGAAAAATAFLAAFCLYRSRRKSSCSVDLTRCRYEHVDAAHRRPATPTLSAAAITPTLTLLNNNNNNDDDIAIKKITTTEHPLL